MLEKHFRGSIYTAAVIYQLHFLLFTEEKDSISRPGKCTDIYWSIIYKSEKLYTTNCPSIWKWTVCITLKNLI